MKPLSDSKGFSMIEMLIAIVILSISLLAMAGLMARSTQNTSFGGHMTEAATFAQDKLEELRAGPWIFLVNGNDNKTGATGANYTRTWTVATNAASNLRTITMTVAWTDKANHQIQFLSAIGQ